MAENLEVLNVAVSLLIRATLFAAGFSGRVRRRSLRRLAAMDADAKAKEILFLKDRVYQLEMQVSILRKHLHKKGRKPRYEVRERLLILRQMEVFQIPRRKVSRYFGIVRSTLYRWLHKIQDETPSGTAVNKTSAEIALLVWERVIKTLKYEWLKRVPLIKGFDHLALLCTEFESWYNTSRPHMTLEGLRPDDFYYDRKPEEPERDVQTVPNNIERHVFTETRVTAYRLKIAA